MRTVGMKTSLQNNFSAWTSNEIILFYATINKIYNEMQVTIISSIFKKFLKNRMVLFDFGNLTFNFTIFYCFEYIVIIITEWNYKIHKYIKKKLIAMFTCMKEPFAL